MHHYLARHSSRQGPLFVLVPNHFLIRADVVNLIRCCLPGVAGVNTHSFRIGGASAAASMNIPDSHIQILGRWSSNAYLRYLHLSDIYSIVSRYCNSLGQASSHSQVWDPVSCTSRPLR